MSSACFHSIKKMIFIHLLHLSCKTYCDLIFRNLLYISGGGDSEDCPNIERLLHQKEVSSEHNLVLEFIYARNALELVIVKNLFLIIYAQVRPRVSYISLKQHPDIFLPFLED